MILSSHLHGAAMSSKRAWTAFSAPGRFRFSLHIVSDS